MCVVDAGLDESPALGIFVLINTSLHTFYLSMLWRLEEGAAEDVSSVKEETLTAAVQTDL